MPSPSPQPNKSKEDYAAIRRALSASRFDSYRQQATDTDDLIFARYRWNVSLSEAFYLPLRMLEVVFRNRFNQAFAANFNNPNWLMVTPNWFDAVGVESVNKARQALQERGKQVTQDRLVQEMRFGFWTSLLNRRHEDRVFRPMAGRLFPGQARPLRTLSVISPRFESIRRFRNRVFHHQRICHYNLIKNLEEIQEAMKWMDPVAMPLLMPGEIKQRLQAILAMAPLQSRIITEGDIDGSGI